MRRYFIHMTAFLMFLFPGSGRIGAQDFANDLNTRQIAIEAMVVEINEEYTRNIGLSYTLSRKEGTDTNLKAVDVEFPFTPVDVKVPVFNEGARTVNYTNRMPGLGLALSGMDVGTHMLSANLRALLESGKAEVRAHAIAVALHKTPVTIETVDEVPFQDVSYSKGQPKLDVSYEKVGVRLGATPEILDLKKGRIRLEIKELDLSSVTGYVTLQNVNRPIFAKSSANTRLDITHGETVILGGFKTMREVVSESGIPFLRRIPVLGYLFKSEKKVQENKDILFFITPYLLEPGLSPILPYDFRHGKFLEIKKIPVTFE